MAVFTSCAKRAGCSARNISEAWEHCFDLLLAKACFGLSDDVGDSFGDEESGVGVGYNYIGDDDDCCCDGDERRGSLQKAAFDKTDSWKLSDPHQFWTIAIIMKLGLDSKVKKKTNKVVWSKTRKDHVVTNLQTSVRKHEHKSRTRRNETDGCTATRMARGNAKQYGHIFLVPRSLQACF